jgi:hypothetical protein
LIFLSKYTTKFKPHKKYAASGAHSSNVQPVARGDLRQMEQVYTLSKENIYICGDIAYFLLTIARSK